VSYRFEVDESVREAITRCAQEQLDGAVRELSEEIDDDPVEAVHSARKAVKKERAMLRLARGTLAAKQRRRDNAALRDAARELAGARDAEVMLETLDELAERFAGQLPESTFKAVREPLERIRKAERSRVLDSPLTAEAIEELEAIRERIDDWELKRSGWRALDSGLERSYRRGRQGLRCVRDEPSFENLHEWRKRVKDLWYELRLLTPACGPSVNGQAEEADRLADLLGDDHDLGVLRETLVELDAEAAKVFVVLIAETEHGVPQAAELRGG
jgi:CHAD domain-containing protein